MRVLYIVMILRIEVLIERLVIIGKLLLESERDMLYIESIYVVKKTV